MKKIKIVALTIGLIVCIDIIALCIFYYRAKEKIYKSIYIAERQKTILEIDLAMKRINTRLHEFNEDLYLIETTISKMKRPRYKSEENEVSLERTIKEYIDIVNDEPLKEM